MNHPQPDFDKSTLAPLRVYVDLNSQSQTEGEEGGPERVKPLAEQNINGSPEDEAVFHVPSDFDMEANDLHWQQYAAIEIDFPTFQDGRGYSHAKRLREVYGYKREIRAVGDVRPDQIHYLLRSGFDAIVVPRADQLALFEAALNRFSAYYRGVEAKSWPIRLVSKFI
jgi:uncharacterized protein (DUF934 family)